MGYVDDALEAHQRSLDEKAAASAAQESRDAEFALAMLSQIGPTLTTHLASILGGDPSEDVFRDLRWTYEREPIVHHRNPTDPDSRATIATERDRPFAILSTTFRGCSGSRRVP